MAKKTDVQVGTVKATWRRSLVKSGGNAEIYELAAEMPWSLDDGPVAARAALLRRQLAEAGEAPMVEDGRRVSWRRARVASGTKLKKRI